MLGYEKISQQFFVKRHKKKKHKKKKSVIINSPQSTKGVFLLCFNKILPHLYSELQTFSWIKSKIILLLFKFLYPLSPKSKFVLIADDPQNTSTITEYKRFGTYPFKGKKPFYCYINAVIFVKPAENDSSKSTTFCHGTDILQAEFMPPF